MRDLGDAGLLCRGDDSPGVARAGIAGVDQDRLAGRRDDQRGGAAFDVDERETEA
jgi:hypothetical protein